MFGWREVYMSNSMSDFSKTREVLSQQGVHYKYKVKNMAGNSMHRMGSFGINIDFAYQYYLYVNKKDLEHAKHLIGQARGR